MSAITKANFYNLLKQAVMFSPAGAGKCSQLQTFRVLEQGAGRLLQAENFGATVCDREKPFFWSRAWHNAKYNPNKVIFDFPVLAVIETDYTTSKPLSSQQKRTYNMNLVVLDKYVADCDKGKCKGCEGRTINEIYEDTEALLFQALRYIAGAIVATPDCDEDAGLYNKDYLKALIDTGQINSYTQGKDWGSLMENNISNARAYKAALESAGLYGNAIDIQLSIPYCVETDYDYESVPDFGILAHQAGCKNCG